MNFLTGAFALNAGTYNGSANISFPKTGLELDKRLLVRSQVIRHCGLASLPEPDLVTRLVLNNPNASQNHIRARFYGQD